jgi:hypothetical protein
VAIVQYLARVGQPTPNSIDPNLLRSIRPKRTTLLGAEMLDFYYGSANRRWDGIEECTETRGHRERLLEFKALISPGPNGACDGYGGILAGVRRPMVGGGVATARADASGRCHVA